MSAPVVEDTFCSLSTQRQCMVYDQSWYFPLEALSAPSPCHGKLSGCAGACPESVCPKSMRPRLQGLCPSTGRQQRCGILSGLIGTRSNKAEVSLELPEATTCISRMKLTQQKAEPGHYGKLTSDYIWEAPGSSNSRI